ncbi:MAG: NF038120 family PEP-CTERM protein [Duganella sp.]
MARALLLAGLGLTMLTAVQAAEVTLDFDSLPPMALGHGDNLVAQGFNVTPYSVFDDAQPGDATGAIIDGLDAVSSCGLLLCPGSSGADTGIYNSSYLTVVADGTLRLSSTTAGQTFSVSGFDASFLGSPLYSYGAVPGVLAMVGHRADNTVVENYFELGALTNEGFAFTTYQSLGNFSQQSFVSVEFYAYECVTDTAACWAYTNGLGQFALDNITLTTGAVSAVPEPSAWLMMGAGLLGVASAARRRRQDATAAAA